MASTQRARGPEIPIVPTHKLGSFTQRAASARQYTPHRERRLSKAVLCAYSCDPKNSQCSGFVELRDANGKAQTTRVVQNLELREHHTTYVSWLWTFAGESHTVELSHGRRTGQRKIWVDKVLHEHNRTIMQRIVIQGSNHKFTVGGKQVELSTAPVVKGFEYQLKIEGHSIEECVEGDRNPATRELGTRLLQLPKPVGGIGVTLIPNAQNGPGMVVTQLTQAPARRRPLSSPKTHAVRSEEAIASRDAQSAAAHRLPRCTDSARQHACTAIGAQASVAC